MPRWEHVIAPVEPPCAKTGSIHEATTRPIATTRITQHIFKLFYLELTIKIHKMIENQMKNK